MKQNTALEDLIDFIKKDFCTEYEILQKATELLQKEQEQIKQAWVSGLNEMPKGNAENYFNQTYNNK